MVAINTTKNLANHATLLVISLKFFNTHQQPTPQIVYITAAVYDLAALMGVAPCMHWCGAAVDNPDSLLDHFWAH